MSDVIDEPRDLERGEQRTLRVLASAARPPVALSSPTYRCRPDTVERVVRGAVLVDRE